MCTCIAFTTKDHYFGRTLDIEYSFNEKIVITPRNYNFSLKVGGMFKTKYAMIGAATVVDNYPLYVEATNEKGLSIAGLQFPDNAYYDEPKEGKINITPFELIPWLLGNYSSIKEVKPILKNINLTALSFSKDIPLAPLHFMICDKKESLVLEQTKEGLKVYENHIGVLTNNPPFTYHKMNMNNYLNLTPDTCDNHFSNQIQLTPYGLGFGAIGLPGDNSPSSRFVRAAFNKLNSVCDCSEESSISQFFHILDTVTVVKGTTMTKDKKWNITTYSCCTNTKEGIYYYKTYENNQITAVKMNDINKNSSCLSIYDLVNKQQINYMN